jgi:hypothetical protein
MHIQRSFLRGVHPQSGQRMRGPDGSRFFPSPLSFVTSSSLSITGDDFFSSAKPPLLDR